MTDEILHVHHWHRKKICCQEHPPSTDLPYIECCCRCNQEREIKADYSQVEQIIDKPWPMTIDPRQKSIGVSGNPKFILDKARKLEQKREFEGADATLRAYHERKKRKAESNT